VERARLQKMIQMSSRSVGTVGSAVLPHNAIDASVVTVKPVNGGQGKPGAKRNEASSVD
jgi:hypothetical protein